MRLNLTALVAAALTAASFAAANAGEPAAGEPQQTRKVVRLHHAGAGEHALPDLATMEGDRLKIEDLSTLLPGESRSYWTESGREVLVSRGDGDRYTVEVEGKKVEIGGELEDVLALHGEAGEGGQRRIVVHHEKKAGEGETATVERDVVRMAPLALPEGAEPPVIVEIVDEADGKKERRVIVLRLDEPAAE